MRIGARRGRLSLGSTGEMVSRRAIHSKNIQLIVHLLDSVAQHLGISLRRPAAHALDPACLSLLRGWLSDCESNHPRCQPTSNASTRLQGLPTRLIDITNTPQVPPRLVLSASMPASTKYIALSYCWGPPSQQKPQLTTTKARLQAHQSGIALSSMPLTFQDLITLAKKLGVRYLWIDALCIVQDDNADWEGEAARMFLVYRNAHLTVVAGGPSCHSGFLTRQNDHLFAEIPFRSRKNGVVVDGHYLLSSLGVARTWEADTPHHMFKAAWYKRAWTYQEDIMSRRALYFTDTASFYRCQTHRCLEQDTVTYTNVRQWDKFLDPSPTADATMKRYYLWENLLVMYAERGLTKGRDKFPALSGLARMFGQALRDEYLAGIWRREFHRGMLWFTDSDAAKPPAWRAPTWSWASWDGLVGMMPKVEEPVKSRILLRDAHVELDGRDPYGMVRGGWVVLSACLKPVRLKLREGDPEDWYYADALDEHDKVIAHASLDSITCSGLRIDGSYKPPPVGEIAQFNDVRALLVALICEYAPDPEDEVGKWPEPACPAGILVTPAPQSTCNGGVATFQRIGIFHTTETTGPKVEPWDKILPSTVKLI